MDAEAERYMDVLERPPELQTTYRSAYCKPFSNANYSASSFLIPAGKSLNSTKAVTKTAKNEASS